MRKADRLFEIIQILRRSKKPVTADAMAAEPETSKRSVYRDMAALLAQRVPIRGEAGVGYVLDKGLDMPPLILTADEIEASVPERLRPNVDDTAHRVAPAWDRREDVSVWGWWAAQSMPCARFSSIIAMWKARRASV